jgi:transcriptional regulator with XRE-family HTH domain
MVIMDKNADLEKRFGAKLAYIRKSKKLSQMKLAEIVDMNFNYIGQIERGEANVTIKTMHTLANALDIELRELFDFSF